MKLFVIFEVKNALERPVYWGTEYTIRKILFFFKCPVYDEVIFNKTGNVRIA